jgi:hypothetical protein
MSSTSSSVRDFVINFLLGYKNISIILNLIPHKNIYFKILKQHDLKNKNSYIFKETLQISKFKIKIQFILLLY